jgi:hypothetical protein
MTNDKTPAANSVYVSIAGAVVNRRSLLLRNFVLHGKVITSNPLLHIHAKRCGKFCRRRKGKIPDQRITPHPCGVKTEKTVGRPNIGVMPF